VSDMASCCEYIVKKCSYTVCDCGVGLLARRPVEYAGKRIKVSNTR
jgi:hypothetical protein